MSAMSACPHSTLHYRVENPQKSPYFPSEITWKTFGNHGKKLQKSPWFPQEVAVISARSCRDFLQFLRWFRHHAKVIVKPKNRTDKTSARWVEVEWVVIDVSHFVPLGQRALTRVRLANETKWKWRESNPRPHKETICFLHAYLGLRFRAATRPKPPIATLSPKTSSRHRGLTRLFPI